MNEVEDLLKELIREVKAFKMQLFLDMSDVKHRLRNIDDKLEVKKNGIVQKDSKGNS